MPTLNKYKKVCSTYLLKEFYLSTASSTSFIPGQNALPFVVEVQCFGFVIAMYTLAREAVVEARGFQPISLISRSGLRSMS
jgi:hypothetical protein